MMDLRKDEYGYIFEPQPITLTIAEAEEIIAFVKMHEREEVPEEMWDLTMALIDAVEEMSDGGET